MPRPDSLCCALLLAQVASVAASAPAWGSGSVRPAEDLLDRVLPGSREHFELSIVGRCPGSSAPPCYHVADAGDRVAVVATGMSELTAGIGFYLREYCNMTIGWPRGGGSRTFLPSRWPKVGAPQTRQRNTPWSYMMNVCTHSYSLVWYDWPRWQPLIDWMALSGVNNVLALTGQEEVQYKVFAALGLGDAEIRGWFNGPAFLTWSRGQNEYGAGIAGPLPRSWMRGQWALQRRILARYRELGIVGQLPAFQGSVPAGLKAIMRDSNITLQGATGWVDALDPLFGRVADLWMRTLVEDFGTDHWYQLDGYFNGGTAPWLGRRGRERLPGAPRAVDSGPPGPPADRDWAARGAAVYESLSRTDPDAVWSFQGFAFEEWPDDARHASWLRGFAAAAPEGRFNIIDMDYAAGEWHKWRDAAFFGAKFIWTALHNFGGTDGIKGNLTRVAEMPFAAQEAGGDIWGTGFTPEGIDQNPAFYDLLVEQPWRTARLRDVGAALVSRAQRRYGLRPPAPEVSRAWRALAGSMYSQDVGVQDSTGVAHLPGTSTWDFLADGHTPGRALCDTFGAWSELVRVAPRVPAPGEPFRHDLVDLGRDVLARLSTPASRDFHAAAVPGRGAPSAGNVSRFGRAYLDLLGDLDALVGTDPAFLLGPWLAWARSFARGAADCAAPGYPAVASCADFYEWNARAQLTSWNPTPEGAARVPDGPVDYAAKHWNGLIGGYYRERATRIMHLALAAAAREEAVRPADVDSTIARVTFEWTTAFGTRYPERPVGDAVATSQAMLRKYSPYFAKCAPDSLGVVV